MPYGTIKIDTITFTDGGVDKSVPVSGLVQNPTFTGNITATGTISGNIIQGGTTVSGLTVTGTTANFASGVFTTQVSGVTVIATTGTFTSLTGTTTNGTTASFTTGNFTSLTGTTTTGTTANFASGVFTTQVSGVTVIATTGTFTSLTGTTTTMTSGVFASGTEPLPSISFVSDPNTGIYSPGADQLAVATNGTVRLTTSTTAISSTLPIDVPLGAVGTPSFTFTGDLNTGIYSPAADTLALVTAGNNRLHITSGGLVGIGNSSPAEAKLCINGGISVEGTYLNFKANIFTMDNNGGNSRLNSFGPNITTPGSFDFIGYSSNALVGTTRMFISSAGLVGIGTTPDSFAKLHVSNNGAEGFEFQPGTVTANVNTIFSYKRSTSSYLSLDFLALNHVFRNTGGEAARIDNSGRLLVGTSTSSGPGSTLQVRNDASAAALDIFRSDATTGTSIFGLNKSRGTAAIPLEVADNDVLGYIAFRGYDGTTYQDAAYIHAECDGTWTDGGDTSDNPGRLVFSTTPDNGSSPTSSPPAMTIKSSQEVLIGTSTITANGGILQLKSGITFPATPVAATDVNTLDDYEEGTWAATITPQTSGTITLSADTGHYVKIGKQVVVTSKLAVSAVSTPLGFVKISLPFTSGASIQGSFSAIMENTVSTGAANFWSIVPASSNSLEVYLAAANNPSATSAAQFQAGSTVWLTATYFV